ncbi:polysaccharide deacetylase [Actinocrispum sp. NPDC049592]|uniref:polysaccharide deacetylase n=1 Tax=Actinocrispum sp. NPDC049592 TaxID=3154835 RepID=UPI00342BC809
MGRKARVLGPVVALVVAVVAVIVMQVRQPTTVAGSPTGTTPNTPSPAAALPPNTDPVPSSTPDWMHPLKPGEKPPQFVLFSFDGAGSHEHWQRMLDISQKSNATFSGFLTGIYLLPGDQRGQYTGPGHAPGASSVGFGGSQQEVRTRIDDLNTALDRGMEIGTHYNGHFCRGAEPSVGRWDANGWRQELTEFFTFFDQATKQGLRVDPSSVKGGRTPCLEGRFDVLFPVLAERGMTYDSSKVSDGLAWPRQEDGGIWEFRMPIVRVPALNRKVIMMDYNLWFSLNQAKEDASRRAEFTEITLNTYRAAYNAALQGNRAPMVIGNHFNDWAGGAFASAVEKFMPEVCTKPETVCTTYSQVIKWMRMQPAEVLAALQKQPNAQS